MDVGLTPEMVDYLVSIYVLTYKRGCRCVKPIEISKTLGASKATVSLMLKKLRFKGLVTKEKDGVSLSQRGVTICTAILRRHAMIEKALMRFGIDHDRACEVARRIEVEVDESIVDLIEKETAELELPCDRAICRFESALKARRRL